MSSLWPQWYRDELQKILSYLNLMLNNLQSNYYITLTEFNLLREKIRRTNLSNREKNIQIEQALKKVQSTCVV